MIRSFRNTGAPITALLGFLALPACDRATANERGDALELAAVETRDIVVTVEATGQIEPLRLVEVKSLAGGEIMRLHVDIGDEVQQGSLLAEINPRDVRNSYNQAQADLEVANAALLTREAALKRAQELRQANIMTVQEFESATLDVTNARANVVKARTNLELAEERLTDITIRSPISGTVVAKQVEQGVIISSATSNVGGGTTLVTMADLSVMQVRALIDQTDIGKVQIGQPVRVTVDAYPNRSFSGQVMKIEPQARIEQNVTMFPVLVQLENPERLLLPGMNADVEISIGERRGATALPNGAVMNPRDAQSAALALGISEDAYRAALAASGPGGRGGPAAAREPGAAASQTGGEPAPDGAAASAAAAEPAPLAMTECAALFQRMRGGGGGQNALSEADRARLESCRSTMAATMGGGGQRGGAMRAGGNRGGQSDTRSAVVFVATENGTQPRMVTLGLNDLDYSEVVRGLEPGEHVVLLAGIQLIQQQQQQLDRMRERTSGMPGAPTVGGPGGGRIR